MLNCKMYLFKLKVYFFKQKFFFVHRNECILRDVLKEWNELRCDCFCWKSAKINYPKFPTPLNPRLFQKESFFIKTTLTLTFFFIKTTQTYIFFLHNPPLSYCQYAIVENITNLADFLCLPSSTHSALA